MAAGRRRPLIRWATLAAVALGPLGAQSGGITDDERLHYSTGLWHRGQRKRVTFETSCYYSFEPELPQGCQRGRQESDDWRMHQQRSLERGVLFQLYEGTGGDYWYRKDNWDMDLDPCWDMWYGVTCDEHGLVIALELNDNNLVGQLPASLGELTSLIKLDLSTSAVNYHSHENTRRNRLFGAVPSLQKVSRIEEIEISGNEFDFLPTDLYTNGNSLRILSASHNKLITLPRFLRRFVQLHTLELDHNNIDDRWGPDFGFLANMRYLSLQYNLLQGEIGLELRRMQKIRNLDVSHNIRLEGELPEDISVQWPENDYLAILNTSIGGYISSLCIDVPFCWRFMYDTHKDLTWATAVDVPDIVNLTITLALENAARQAQAAAAAAAAEAAR